MKLINIVGYKKKGIYNKYREPIELQAMEFRDGTYLVDPVIGLSMGSAGILATGRGDGRWLARNGTVELIEGGDK